MEVIPRHDVAVFSVDNLDQTNLHGLMVKSRGYHCLHITAVQAVLCNGSVPLQRKVCLPSLCNQQDERITDREAFTDDFVPSKDYVDITEYIAMFIGAVYMFNIS